MSSFFDKTSVNQEEYYLYAVVLSLVGVMLGNIFIRCVSIMSERLVDAQLKLASKNHELLVHAPPKNESNFGMTTMLYVAILLLMTPWVFVLWVQLSDKNMLVNLLVLGCLAIITLINLVTVIWRSTPREDTV